MGGSLTSSSDRVLVPRHICRVIAVSEWRARSIDGRPERKQLISDHSKLMHTEQAKQTIFEATQTTRSLASSPLC